MKSRKSQPQPNALARTLHDFFADHLQRLRGMSPNTVHSYRDSLTLLLRFVGERKKLPVVSLDVDDIDTEQIASFLEHLETDRRNTASTRNVRLAAVHTFFQYLAGQHP